MFDQRSTKKPRGIGPLMVLSLAALMMACTTTGYVIVLPVRRSFRRRKGYISALKEPAEDEEELSKPALLMGDNSSSKKGKDNEEDAGRRNKRSSSPSIRVSAAKEAGTSTLANKTQRRKMRLQWCDREDVCGDVIRERVSGDHNHMSFSGPATGQVCYVWSEGEDKKESGVAVSSVLILVKQGDDELMQAAASAVHELTKKGIQVLLVPEMAAKLQHLFGVYDDMIKLFEPQAVPGFGENLHPSDMLKDEYGSIPPSHRHNSCGADPDLICTLGGDGLLMHAGMLFPGPVPPILSISGGSLGFLSPFGREEMVDAILMSMGYLKGKEETDIDDIENVNDNFALLSQPGPTPENFYWNGYKAFQGKTSSPPFQFGIGSCICLSMRMRLDCRVINREGIVRARFNVLNEVVIDRGSSPYLAALECFCDDVHLTTVQADGIIFATPTGSTAYSMAAGGSVVHPAVPAILVTPICPHVLSFRSMVFPDHVVLRCFVPDDARSDASVAFDGKHRRELQRGESIQIQMSVYPVPTINRVDHSSDWLNSLKNNFSFNTRARQRPL